METDSDSSYLAGRSAGAVSGSGVLGARAEFEEWANNELPYPVTRDGDGYTSLAVQVAWAAWTEATVRIALKATGAPHAE